MFTPIHAVDCNAKRSPNVRVRGAVLSHCPGFGEQLCFLYQYHPPASSDNKRPDILAGGLIIIIIMWIAAALAASLQPCNLCAHVVSDTVQGDPARRHMGGNDAVTSPSAYIILLV